jgi:hypothetical protein
MYQYFNGMNSVFPGSAPISAMYPVMNPNAMYAMQQSYQNRPMMMPQNMYPQMQVMAINQLGVGGQTFSGPNIFPT